VLVILSIDYKKTSSFLEARSLTSDTDRDENSLLINTNPFKASSDSLEVRSIYYKNKAFFTLE